LVFLSRKQDVSKEVGFLVSISIKIPNILKHHTPQDITLILSLILF